MRPQQTSTFTKEKKQSKSKISKESKQDLREAFFEEIDSGKINTFAQEESFQAFLESMRSKALFIKNGMKVSGNDKINFRIFFPYPMFCATLSQLSFDRKKDVEFRYLRIINNESTII